MPIPFIVAGITAAVGAVGTAVAGAAIATGAAVVAGAGVTLLTVGGVAITAGTLAGVATGAAAAFGISQVLMNETDTYTTSYISESEKRREKERLVGLYINQLKSLEYVRSDEKKYELKLGVENIIIQAKDYAEKQEYYNAINLIKNFKLVYAKEKDNKEIAAEIEAIANEILTVRKETINLR